MAKESKTYKKNGPRVCIRTFGCQMNAYDSEVIAGLFERKGYRLTEEEGEADLILLNTCSVRRHAEDRVWGKLFELRERARREPDLIIGVCGCMAQSRAEEITRRCPHVRLICGTRAFTHLPGLVARARDSKGTVIDIGMDEVPRLAGIPKKRKSKLKAFVTVMRGCENFCSYCIVPYVRGSEVSRTPEVIVEEVSQLAREGVKEVMLLGQNVNSYKGESRKGGEPVLFAGLLRMVSGIEGIERVRFMTSNPKDLGNDLIRAIAEIDEICEHLHLPVQSGSDRVLMRMKRGYTLVEYTKITKKLREAVPGIALTTDIIAGFPGETIEDHQATVWAMEEIGFDAAFIFKYSDREGTKAAEMNPKVPEEVIVRRHAELLKLQERLSLKKNREMVGKSVEVLVEGRSRRNPKRLFGRTRTNKRVVLEGDGNLIGQIVSVTIREATPLTVIG